MDLLKNIIFERVILKKYLTFYFESLIRMSLILYLDKMSLER